ncbi:MAG: LysR family transcriptional regulator [Hyphomicrobiales bacterium]|nr:LysR family transcriptional regulator [Hyphomicrobiales bacterium]
MHNQSLRQIDLNLLLVFDAIYSEGSVTAAATRLFLSQPATSNALNRLQSQLGVIAVQPGPERPGADG